MLLFSSSPRQKEFPVRGFIATGYQMYMDWKPLRFSHVEWTPIKISQYRWIINTFEVPGRGN
jgi:hypothetical protein